MGLKPVRNSSQVNSPQQGLNRTSVGLKLKLDSWTSELWAGPQSNQRGIETGFEMLHRGVISLPQSNQRGIETQHTWTTRVAEIAGPQSNQRGIETAFIVGGPAPIPDGPQSNQRGIETLSFTTLKIFCAPWASIEPAWD